MAGHSNGRAKKPGKAAPNGSASGSANGHLNGHADKSRPAPAKQANPRRKPRPSWTRSFTNLVARLVSWYLIVTFVFRCPSSLTQLSDSSPKACNPYLHARLHAAPYVDPYYQTYVAPHVEKVQPYVDTFDQRVYTPVSTFTKNQYATYGAHRVEQAQKYAEAEWARTARPQIQQLQNKAYAQYEHHLGPHVKKASDALGPYLEQTKASLVEIYHLSILPTYEALLPYGRQAYAQGHRATVRIIFPAVQSGRDATWKFVSRTLWPYVRVLYGDNVEPQLVRIRERLGRYKDQQKVESVLEAVQSSSTALPENDSITSTATLASSVSSAVSSATESTKSGWGVLDDFFGAESSATPSEVEIKTPTQPKQPQLTGAELREKLNQDLREWQTKFATAADKGADDLDVRVADITKRQIENGVHGHGAAMIVQLEETAESTISSLKKFTKQTVKSLPEDATEEQLEKAHQKCIAKMRELGLAVKEKSQAVRNWKLTFDQETDNLVRAAVGSTVEVLEKIHGLGLQEVGMRWAWLDGVEYKDWQNYHKLRETLNEWQEEVEAVGAKHDGLKAAHEEAAKLEDKAMTIASTMVNELVRLKDVSKWKIWAGDQTEDFSDKKVPVRAYNAAQQVLSNAQEASSQASEAVLGSETPASESIASVVKASASSASSQLSEKALGSETPAAESLASVAKASTSSASSQLSEKIAGSETPAAESIASAAKKSASDVATKVSEAVVGSETPATESLASAVESQASDAAENIESATKAAKKSAEAAASVASEAPKKVWGGVDAQVIVEAREPVFDDIVEDDDEGTYSEKIQSIVADAGDRASDLSRAVSQALLGATKTQGTAESVTSLASEQYVKALAAASSVLYGTQQAPLDSATSIASDRFASAVTAASYAIYGTPTPPAVIQTVRTHASSRYNEAVSIANAQFENAKSQFSVLVSGTTKPAHETMLAMIEKAYSDSLAAASERLDAALQYTESVKSYAAGPTQGYFESVSSIASSRLSEGLSQATAQFSSQPTDSPVLDGARRQYYEAIGLAHARYSEFLGAASTAVYGPEQGTIESLASVASESAASIASSAQSYASDVTDSAQSAAAKAQEAAASLASQVSSGVIGSETAWTESVASQASQNWEALIAKASSQVYGAPTPWAASVYSQAGEYAAQATAQAAEQAAAVQALISELVIGKEPDFTESVMARFSAAYYTGLPAAVSSVNSIASENIAAATSYAGESFEAASEFAAEAYASASSVIESVFVPPPAIETIISNVNDQLNAAVESASAAVYGTQKGTIEQASESVASAYASVQSKASEAIYGTAQASHDFAAVASSAQSAISEAIFGSPTATGYAATASNGAAAAASVYSSVASVASEKAANAAAAASEAIYGPEQGAVESASARLAAAVEAANSRISELYAAAATNAEAVASSASSVAADVTKRVKDEL